MHYKPGKVRALIFFYILYYLIPVYLVLGPTGFNGVGTYRVGQLFGILGISSLSMQLFLTARIMWLERGVGMDKLTRWHKFNSRLILTFLILHPVLMFWDSLINPATWLKTLSFFTIYHWLGITALLLIFIQIATTIYSATIKLNYEHWKVIHKIAYIIIVLGFIHSLFLGSDLAAPTTVYYWWMFAGGLVLYAFCYRNIYRPLKFQNSLYAVEKVLKETSDVRSIYLKPLGKKLSYAPGQFAFARFYSAKVPREEHHFTISSKPTDPYLTFTIKESGDYTSLLGRLKVGERVRIEGPYGEFSNVGMPGPFVFIAGGIGITPVMSMLRTMEASKKTARTTLIYVNKTLADTVFQKELVQMEKSNKWLKLAYVLSQDTKPNCYSGRLSSDILKQEVKDFTLPTFFVVGPVPMMDATVQLLKEQGVPSKKILTERFALR